MGHCQSWILLGHFEVQNLWFSRAAMTASRGVRLAQILGLDRIDGGGGLGPTLPPPRDWVEQEERRRTMWTVFCDDRNTSSTTNWPCLLDPKRVKLSFTLDYESLAYKLCRSTQIYQFPRPPFSQASKESIQLLSQKHSTLLAT